ncbi:hypothetical protein [Paenibacillus sp. HB172176]|uniref:DUF6115 domain-containing protein n=1 Tax=Paenibacillus sp. HB172176 TaxID=2493690 RepID=UPI00143BBF2F|nr:hypothetical protein [Paenibacillus sp. HB172176]
MDPLQNIILIGAVVIVGAFLMPKKRKPAESMRTVQSMETALEQFMESMEKDNADVMNLITASQEANKKETDEKDRRIAALEARCEQLGQLLEHSMKQSQPDDHVDTHEVVSLKSQASSEQASLAEANHAAADARSPNSGKEQDANKEQSIQARYAELFELHHNGKSIEAIAKSMGLNKGEVQLIIQLAKQEGERRV